MRTLVLHFGILRAEGGASDDWRVELRVTDEGEPSGEVVTGPWILDRRPESALAEAFYDETKHGFFSENLRFCILHHPPSTIQPPIAVTHTVERIKVLVATPKGSGLQVEQDLQRIQHAMPAPGRNGVPKCRLTYSCIFDRGRSASLSSRSPRPV